MMLEQEVRQLYLKDEQNIVEISKRIGMPVMTLYNRMLKWGIPIRGKRNPTLRSRLAKSQKYTKFRKSSFSGDRLERAYLVGFFLGDLSAVRNSMAIRVTGGTTHRAQAELFHKLFDRYGKAREYVSINKITKYEACRRYLQLYVDLDQSFSFLLDKKNLIQESGWYTDEEMWRFVAGFFDAEGCISVHRPSSGSIQFRLSILNKDFFTLNHISDFLTKHSIHNIIIESKENTKTLIVYRKQTVKNTLQQLADLFQHEEKIQKAAFVMRNISATRYDVIKKDWKDLTADIKLKSKMVL